MIEKNDDACMCYYETVKLGDPSFYREGVIWQSYVLVVYSVYLLGHVNKNSIRNNRMV